MRPCLAPVTGRFCLLLGGLLMSILASQAGAYHWEVTVAEGTTALDPCGSRTTYDLWAGPTQFQMVAGNGSSLAVTSRLVLNGPTFVYEVEIQNSSFFSWSCQGNGIRVDPLLELRVAADPEDVGNPQLDLIFETHNMMVNGGLLWVKTSGTLSLNGNALIDLYTDRFGSGSTERCEVAFVSEGDRVRLSESDPMVPAYVQLDSHWTTYASAKGILRYSIRGTLSVPDASCEAPKALLVAYPLGPQWEPGMSRHKQVARNYLQGNGWEAVEYDLPPDHDWAQVVNMMQGDDCIRGFYIIGHGTQDPGYEGKIAVLEQGTRKWLLPEEISNAISTEKPLRLVTAQHCFLQRDLWENAFSSSTVRTTRLPIQGIANSGREIRAIESLDWGVEGFSCATPTSKAHPDRATGRGDWSLSSAAGCDPMWLLAQADDTEISYPVDSCADSLAVASTGAITLGSAEAMFQLTTWTTGGAADTVYCEAQLLRAAPDTLVHPDARALGRHLLFWADPGLSAATVDSFTVQMRYEEQDVILAGIPREQSLSAYWLSPDSTAFTLLRSEIDTMVNVVSFTAPSWGVVGLYEHEATGLESPLLVSRAVLRQNHPNPFNPSTTLRFELESGGRVQLDVYDMAGRHVRRLVDGLLSAGPHTRSWDGRDAAGRPVASGVYLARLRAEEGESTVRMVLLK